ncbi:hypothetical protein TcWFU_008725 [Taenia crassiceps]|uniref:Uncharacterized protein n=1 Tax=Taenia crassiceps TaxID=6207 RepID=A0ABR4QET0_9CEST
MLTCCGDIQVQTDRQCEGEEKGANLSIQGRRRRSDPRGGGAGAAVRSASRGRKRLRWPHFPVEAVAPPA